MVMPIAKHELAFQLKSVDWLLIITKVTKIGGIIIDGKLNPTEILAS